MALTGCCGCRNLKSGTIAIGITLIVLYALGALYDTGRLIYKVVNGVDISTESILIGIGYALQAAGIGFNVALIMGVKRASRSLILSWVIFQGIIFGFTSLAVLILVVLVFLVIGNVVVEPDLGITILITLVFAVVNAVEWYWFAVVIAHMNEIDDASLEFGYRRQEEAVVMHSKDTI